MDTPTSPVDDDRFVLELSSKRIDFQPVSKDVSVFYDESNRQVCFIILTFDLFSFLNISNKVFIVINRGAEGIVVKGSDDLTLKFWCVLTMCEFDCALLTIDDSLQDRGNIHSIKFSPTFEILSLQRSQNYIEFVIFKNGQPVDIFSHTLKVIFAFFNFHFD